jgi:hypothetical protein
LAHHWKNEKKKSEGKAAIAIMINEIYLTPGARARKESQRLLALFHQKFLAHV